MQAGGLAAQSVTVLFTRCILQSNGSPVRSLLSRRHAGDPLILLVQWVDRDATGRFRDEPSRIMRAREPLSRDERIGGKLKERGLRSTPQTIEVWIFPVEWRTAISFECLALDPARLFVLPLHQLSPFAVAFGQRGLP